MFQCPNFFFNSSLKVGSHSSGCFLASTICLQSSSYLGLNSLLSSDARTFGVGLSLLELSLKLYLASSSKLSPRRTSLKIKKHWPMALVSVEK